MGMHEPLPKFDAKAMHVGLCALAGDLRELMKTEGSNELTARELHQGLQGLSTHGVGQMIEVSLQRYRYIQRMKDLREERRVPTELEIRLLDLVQKERTGREVAKRYKQKFLKPLSYGALYPIFRRMVERRWVSERLTYDEDGRVRNFLITAAGHAAWRRAERREF